jgi:hypothetical protein
MKKFDSLVELQIAEAMARGDFDNLPGQGQPLDLSEDPFTPEEHRMVNRIMKNSGIIPPEVQMLNEISQLRERLKNLESSSNDEREKLRKELHHKETAVRTAIEALKRRSR